MTRKKRRHRSVSQVSLWKRCEVAYGFRYDERRRGAPSVPIIRGLSVHASVGYNLGQKVSTRIDLPLDVVTDFTAQEVDQHFNGRIHLSREELSVGKTKMRGATKDRAVEMARAFHLRQAPMVDPLYVEKLIRVKTDPKLLDFDVVARIDHATRDHTVWDVKTSAGTMGAGREHIDEQLTLYYPVHKAKTGRYPKAVGFLVVSQTRNQPARIERRLSTRTHHDVVSMVQTLKAIDRSIESGHRTPTAPDNWWCSEKWCDYWNVCPFVKGIRERRRTDV